MSSERLKREVKIELSVRKALASGAWKAVDEIQTAVYADIGISVGPDRMRDFLEGLKRDGFVESGGGRRLIHSLYRLAV